MGRRRGFTLIELLADVIYMSSCGDGPQPRV
ncbi:MAG: prepilin-type N-terminal cleavage/methylation domain-containing protein [Armatimonadota bacterium]|jgi:hypothetical protein